MKKSAPILTKDDLDLLKENAELKQSLRKVVAAWESLPGDKRYGAREIESWLINKMSPAINHVRCVLSKDQGSTSVRRKET